MVAFVKRYKCTVWGKGNASVEDGRAAHSSGVGVRVNVEFGTSCRLTLTNSFFLCLSQQRCVVWSLADSSDFLDRPCLAFFVRAPLPLAAASPSSDVPPSSVNQLPLDLSPLRSRWDQAKKSSERLWLRFLYLRLLSSLSVRRHRMSCSSWVAGLVPRPHTTSAADPDPTLTSVLDLSHDDRQCHEQHEHRHRAACPRQGHWDRQL